MIKVQASVSKGWLHKQGGFVLCATTGLDAAAGQKPESTQQLVELLLPMVLRVLFLAC